MAILLKNTEHGQRFSRTVEQILETIVERILIEDIDGCPFLEKVGVILHHYVEFNLLEALRIYGELRPKLAEFIAGLQKNASIRIQTWEAIDRILVQLASDGVRFLAIEAEK